MSQDQQLQIARSSYVATCDHRIPKYVIKVELLKADETETAVVMRSCVKTQYVVYEEADNILTKIHHILYVISAEMGERTEKL